MMTTLVELDLRPMLRAGGEPFEKIMQTVAALGPDQGLRLFATFKPTPLLRVLESKGFVHEAKELEGGEWEVLFRPSKAAAADGDAGAVLPTDNSVWPEPVQQS